MYNSENNLDKQFGLYKLNESDLDPDPIKQFGDWFGQALKTGLIHPNAFTLSTSNKEGKPAARILLLKGFDENGFVFYTNTDSRKGHDLNENPFAAMCFWWGKLERQIRIEGSISIVSVEEADEYFATRPRGSQIGAWASNQSTVIADRGLLDDKVIELENKFKDAPVPRPPYWNGYRLSPVSIEFWQGRDNRLHDRLRYRLEDGDKWIVERLAP